MAAHNPLAEILIILEEKLPALIASLNLKFNENRDDNKFFKIEWEGKVKKWSILLKEKLEKDAVHIERLMENENIKELSEFQLDYPELRWLRCLDRNSGLFITNDYWYFERLTRLLT